MSRLGKTGDPFSNMKKLIVGLMVLVCSWTAYSQGTIFFNNRISGVVDARVLLHDGTGAGAGWTAQLWGGPAGTPVAQLKPLTPEATFRTSSSAAMGYVSPENATISNVRAGAQAVIVMRAFMAGSSYDTSVLRGESNPITVFVGGSTLTPASLVGLESFTVGQNPLAFSITASVQSHASITPTSAVRLQGESQRFVAAPDPGYGVEQWFVDGEQAQSGGITFTLENIRSEHTVSVTLKELEHSGLVVLNNRIPGILDARVLLPDGRGVGEGWTAQLYGGPAGTTVSVLEPLLPTTTFRTSSPQTAGYLTSVDVAVPGVAPGANATLVLRVYDGDSYETSSRRGESAPFTISLGGGVLPPVNLLGLQGFTIPDDRPTPVEGGLISFNNRIVGIVDARILLPNGAGAGLGWTAQLYCAAEGKLLAPLFPATTFRTSSASAMGYVNPVDVSAPGVNPGEPATIVLVVFNGDSFETSPIAAQSSPIVVTLGGGTLPPANLVGLEGFTLSGEEKPRVEGGLISFNNRVIGVVDARVLLANGNGAGEGWTAQLYGAAEDEPLVPLLPTTVFRTSSAAAAGYVNPVDVAVPGVNPGERATVVMTVFNGDSFETAPLAGQSEAIVVTLGGNTLPPANLIGMEGFTVTSDEPPAQDAGLVTFNNRVSGVVDARVLLADGTGAGPGWKAQLFGGTEGEPLVPLLPATTFRTTSAQAMGYVNSVVVAIPGVPPGKKATLMMTAFNGETFESSILSGRSAPITVTLGGGTLPPSNLVGLEGFTMAGNPPVIFRQPVSQTAVAGSAVTFSVTASGSGQLNYQWSFNRTSIRGANSAVLTLDNVQNTQTGLYTVAVSSSDGVVISEPAELTLIDPAVDGDFNGDGLSDILFQDNNGSLAVWFMDGAKLQAGRFLNPIRVGDKKWRVAGLGDFNQDGSEDILFQHDRGTLSVWFMDGVNRSSVTFLDPTDPGDKNWRVVTVEDFNEDGNPDIVLQHDEGWLAIWYMDGIHLETAEFLQPNHPGDAKWTVVGSGDFNTDGKPDLAFQHQDGTLALWYLDGTRLTQSTLLNPSLPNEAPWRVRSVTDLDSDGQPDLLFQHRGVGTIAVWFMDNDELRSARLLNPSRPGSTWEIVGP